MWAVQFWQRAGEVCNHRNAGIFYLYSFPLSTAIWATLLQNQAQQPWSWTYGRHVTSPMETSTSWLLLWLKWASRTAPFSWFQKLSAKALGRDNTGLSLEMMRGTSISRVTASVLVLLWICLCALSDPCAKFSQKANTLGSVSRSHGKGYQIPTLLLPKQFWNWWG